MGHKQSKGRIAKKNHSVAETPVLEYLDRSKDGIAVIGTIDEEVHSSKSDRHDVCDELDRRSDLASCTISDSFSPSVTVPQPGDANLVDLIKRLEKATGKIESVADGCTVATTKPGPRSEHLNTAAHQPESQQPDTQPTNRVQPHRSVAAEPHTLSDVQELPSLKAYDDVLRGPLVEYVASSDKIGGLVAEQAKFLKRAMEAQRSFLEVAARTRRPHEQSALSEMLKPTSECISNVMEIKDRNRRSDLFSHLAAIAEGVAALAWVTVEPAPVPYIREMADAGSFYINRILKEFRAKDPVHTVWTKCVQTLWFDLQVYVKLHHGTGLGWNKQGTLNGALSNGKSSPKSAVRGKSPTSSVKAREIMVSTTSHTPTNPKLTSVPKSTTISSNALQTTNQATVIPPTTSVESSRAVLTIAAPQPSPKQQCSHIPAPPPQGFNIKALAQQKVDKLDPSALLASINKGSDITKGLRKVTGDNTRYLSLKSSASANGGSSPIKTEIAQQNGGGVVPKGDQAKLPVIELRGRKWIIENIQDSHDSFIEETDSRHTVYMHRCINATVQIKGKVNSVVLDTCSKTSVVVDDAVCVVEFINCSSVKAQILGQVPTVSIDKTDGCQVFLSEHPTKTSFISAKSSEMNICIPTANGDYTEYPIPEQFKTHFDGKKLVTVPHDT